MVGLYFGALLLGVCFILSTWTGLALKRAQGFEVRKSQNWGSQNLINLCSVFCLYLAKTRQTDV